MSTLVLPVAGKSTRFSTQVPKWLLKMPNGRLMLSESVSKIHSASFDRIIVTCLAEHLDMFVDEAVLSNLLREQLDHEIEVCALNEETSSQSETVFKTLEKMNVNGPFFVKDCDNIFEFEWDGKNQIATVDLHTMSTVDASNKSYVSNDALNQITNIVEKEIISSSFCCGGYGFENSDAFKEHFLNINQPNEIYISHVVFSMLSAGHVFFSKSASQYIDLGTSEEYSSFLNKFSLSFIYLDDILFDSNFVLDINKYLASFKATVGRQLTQEQKDTSAQFIALTGLSSKHTPLVHDFLTNKGLSFREIIFDCPNVAKTLMVSENGNLKAKALATVTVPV